MRSNVEKWNLLKHPFYRAWEDGSLSEKTLKEYAKDYFHHVSAFPRYLSRLHSNTENIETRQILLENLVDEEKGSDNHPKLWADFCEALGWSREELKNTPASEGILQVIDGFLEFANKSSAAGLGALYAYESQIPEIAEFKLEALKKFYVKEKDWEKLKFFEVHKVADQYHRAALEDIFSKMSPEEKAEAMSAAEEAAQNLWNFLSFMHEKEMAAA